MNYSSPATIIWDEKHIKALLRMHGHSLSKLQVEPWRSWIKQYGGINHLRQGLATSLLPPKQQELLTLILDYPGASSIFYASKLNISQSNYFLHLKNLIEILRIELNNWKIEPPQDFREQSFLLNNLPVPLTPLIGAEESVAKIIAALHRPEVRLLTLMGPGGVGKTRVAIAAGARLLKIFSDGVFFIHLETLNDPALIIPQIAHSLNIETSVTQPLSDALKAYLRERQILLILDNFEQLAENGPLVSNLLQSAYHLKVLVTSRQALNVYGENRFVVPELTRPNPDNLPPLDQLRQWPAIDLFVQRIQARHPVFILTDVNKEAIVRICHQLDGLPLAIELAAAQVKLFAPDQILPHLERGLKSLKDTSREKPLRQKTLWDAIDWSYQLLFEPEKILFRRLAVFGRVWSLEAAQDVCETNDVLTYLEGLVDKSLLRYIGQGEDGSLRFQMLQAVREYAFDQLENNTETQKTQRRHANYFLGMIEQAEFTFGLPEQLDSTRRIQQDLENLQIALQWMLDAKETEMAFRFLGAGWRFYHMLNIWSETRIWMDRALTQGTHIKSTGRVKTLWGASWLAANQGDYAQATMLADEGLSLAREIGDKRLIGLLLQNVADGFYRHKEYVEAMSLLEESLHIFRTLEDQEETAFVLARIASIFWLDNKKAQAKELLQESLTIFRTMGHQWAIASILRQLGDMALEEDDNELAAHLLEESLEISRQLGAKQRISEILRELASLRWRHSNFEEVQAALEESLAISHEIGDQMGLGWTINLQGRLALQQSDILRAKELFERAQAIFQKIGDETAIHANLVYLERVALAEKEHQKN